MSEQANEYSPSHATWFYRELIKSFTNKNTKTLTISEELMHELLDRIEFLEVRQTELQEEGTKLITQRRELKAEIIKLKELIEEC